MSQTATDRPDIELRRQLLAELAEHSPPADDTEGWDVAAMALMTVDTHLAIRATERPYNIETFARIAKCLGSESAALEIAEAARWYLGSREFLDKSPGAGGATRAPRRDAAKQLRVLEAALDNVESVFRELSMQAHVSLCRVVGYDANELLTKTHARLRLAAHEAAKDMAAGAEEPKGRAPLAARGVFLAKIAAIYERVTGRPATVTKDTEGYYGHYFNLLKLFVTELSGFQEITDHALAQAVKRANKTK